LGTSESLNGLPIIHYRSSSCGIAKYFIQVRSTIYRSPRAVLQVLEVAKNTRTCQNLLATFLLLPSHAVKLEINAMWPSVALFAVRWSFRQLALGIWLLVLVGGVVGLL